MTDGLKVLIVRDRISAGGGIHGYFEAIAPHLSCSYLFCDVGRPQGFYGGRAANGWLISGIRLVGDWFRLGWAILRFRPGLVHVNAGLDQEERSLRREALSLRIARMLGCPVLVFWHGWDHPAKGGEQFPGGRGGWLWSTYTKAAAHVVLATSFRDDLKRWGFGAPVHLATTVISPEFLADGAGQAPACGKNLLFLSRVERAKGLWELLDAYALLKTRDSGYRLVIAGDGPDLAALKQRVAELGLADVTFAGFVAGDERLQILREASIFCFPSYSEGMPLAVLEAMAMGLPVVSSDVGGLEDILNDGEHAILLTLLPSDQQGRRFDPAEIASAIKRLTEDPQLSQTIGQRNMTYARTQFAPERVARDLEQIYHSAAARNSQSHRDHKRRI
jgi:glycosyltransferase involved in cell wall biosynthesis